MVHLQPKKLKQIKLTFLNKSLDCFSFFALQMYHQISQLVPQF